MSARERKQDILLESGGNEVEMMEFYLGSQSFGVNVAKVRKIIQFEPALLTRTPDTDAAVMGVVLVRDEAVNLMDLNTVLKRKPPAADPARENKDLVLITEFSGKTVGFLVNGVNRIHRVSWGDLKPMDYFHNVSQTSFTGSINIEGNEILVVDFERILSQLDPESYALESLEAEQPVKSRATIRVILAEDSNYIRELLVANLRTAGFNRLEAFDNGQDAMTRVLELRGEAQKTGKTLADLLDLVITDIEMPKMDGLTLCRKIKEELCPALPVLVFSSLVNEQMSLKCKEVQANAFVAKPKLKDLLALIDSLALGADEPKNR